MIKFIHKQQEFQSTFGRPVQDVPVMISAQDAVFRHHLIAEELQEYIEAAVLQRDLVEVADALGDLLYVVFGTINEHGMTGIIEEVFNEIHRSNMSKLFYDSEKGHHFRNDKNGKTLKPDTYSPPDIMGIIKKAIENNTTDERYVRNRAR